MLRLGGNGKESAQHPNEISKRIVTEKQEETFPYRPLTIEWKHDKRNTFIDFLSFHGTEIRALNFYQRFN